MDFSPVWISLKTTVCASVITFVIGILAAWAVMFIKGRKLKAAVDGLLSVMAFRGKTPDRELCGGSFWFPDCLFLGGDSIVCGCRFLPSDVPLRKSGI